MTKVSGLTPQTWNVADLKPYDVNAKKHPQAQIDALAKEIKDLGYDVYIVIEPDGTIIKGHGRRLAIMQLGWERVQVIVRDDLSEAQMRRARLSDNVVSDLGGGYDKELFDIELGELANFDVDMDIFSDFSVDTPDFSGDAANDPVNPKPEDTSTAPPIDEHKYEAQFNITVPAKDEAEQEAIYNLLKENGYECTVQSM